MFHLEISVPLRMNYDKSMNQKISKPCDLVHENQFVPKMISYAMRIFHFYLIQNEGKDSDKRMRGNSRLS